MFLKRSENDPQNENNQAKTKSEKALEREQEAKKKKTLKIVAAVAASVILMVLLFGLINYGANGTFLPKSWMDYFHEQELNKQMSAVVATMGDSKLTNGLLQVYYWTSVQDYMSSALANNVKFPDTKTPLDEQFYDEAAGKTWQQFFLEDAVLDWQQFQAVTLEANKAGFEVSEEVKTEVQTLVTDLYNYASKYGYRNVEHMLSFTLGEGITFENYMTFIWQSYTTYDYWQTVVDSIELTRDQVKDYFVANAEQIKKDTGITLDSGKLVDVRHILIQPKGGTYDEKTKETTYTDEEWEACLEEAQELYDEWLKGEHTEESFIALVEDNTDDPGSESKGGLYTWVRKGDMVKEFDAWCFDESRKPGDHDLVRTKFGYHFMYYVAGDDAWFRYGELAALDAEGAKQMEEVLKEYPLTVDYEAAILCPVSLKLS